MRKHTKNLYIRKVLRGGRKSCPTCKQKLNGLDIYSVGEYERAKWHKAADDFCMRCHSRFLTLISNYEVRNEDSFVTIVGYQGEEIPRGLLIDRYSRFLAENLGFNFQQLNSGKLYNADPVYVAFIVQNDWSSKNIVLHYSTGQSCYSGQLTYNIFLTQENLQTVREKLLSLQNILS